MAGVFVFGVASPHCWRTLYCLETSTLCRWFEDEVKQRRRIANLGLGNCFADKTICIELNIEQNTWKYRVCARCAHRAHMYDLNRMVHAVARCAFARCTAANLVIFSMLGLWPVGSMQSDTFQVQSKCMLMVVSQSQSMLRRKENNKQKLCVLIYTHIYWQLIEKCEWINNKLATMNSW